MRKHILAIKYWLQGDDWRKATEYAEAITRWTRRAEKPYQARVVFWCAVGVLACIGWALIN